MPRGMVTRTEGLTVWVDCGGGEIPCVLRGRLKKRQLHATSLVVVGDLVEVEAGPGQTGVVAAIAPRRSELSRPGFRGLPHVIAANLDQVVVVQSARQPAYRGRLVDRFLVTAARGKMGALVVVNKCDLEAEAVIRSWVRPLEDNRVRVILTSALDGRGLDELRQAIAGRVSVLAGQSGVGKSSLLNAMYPGSAAATGGVSAASGKGRHTTSSSRLHALPDGGYLVDTPGIRTLALEDEDDGLIAGVFPEIQELAADCKFRDCTHSHEPRCAVKQAVERGDIDPSRYESYLRMLKNR
ncbi:MAG: ribosome small subunit-dependent GTPase A [bacterium]|nr:ribosome small subunit-dependent GTPase A [bacterium]